MSVQADENMVPVIAAPASASLPAGSAAISPSAFALLTMINVFWGASSVATKYGLSGFGPFTLVLARFVPAGLLLCLIARSQGKIVPLEKRDRLPLFVLAFVGIALTYSVLFLGIARTTATDASLLFACEPLLIALFARVFLRERLSGVQWAGMLLGLYGVRLIAGQGMGNALALLGLCFECSTSVIGKRLANVYPGLMIVAYEMLIGSLLVLPFAGWEIAHHAPHLSLPSLAGAAYLSVISSALCYGVWYSLLERYPISAMGATILIQPLTGPVFGWVLRHEPLHPVTALGGLLVLLGIALTTLLQRRKTEEETGRRGEEE